MGDLAGGSAMTDPASKETRSFPSSAGLLTPESRSPVLLFLGSLSVSKASSDLSSLETTCRMAESTRGDKGQSTYGKDMVEFLRRIEKKAELPDDCSSPSGTCKLTDIPSTCKSSSDMLQKVNVWAPLAQMVNERCLHRASRYLGQRDADFKVA